MTLDFSIPAAVAYERARAGAEVPHRVNVYVEAHPKNPGAWRFSVGERCWDHRLFRSRDDAVLAAHDLVSFLWRVERALGQELLQYVLFERAEQDVHHRWQAVSVWDGDHFL